MGGVAMSVAKSFFSIALVALGVGVGCGRGAEKAGGDHELPSLNVTHWTDKTELYMEYPPLVSGEKALFAVHLTRLSDFKPVSEGHAQVEFTPESGGEAKTLMGPSPSRPGAFRVEDVPPAPGNYRWALVLDSSNLSDRHDLGSITIYADDNAARAAGAPPEDPAA